MISFVLIGVGQAKIGQGIFKSSPFPHIPRQHSRIAGTRLSYDLDTGSYYTPTGRARFYFASDKRHSIKNIGKGPAKILWVVTPPTFSY